MQWTKTSKPLITEKGDMKYSSQSWSTIMKTGDEPFFIVTSEAVPSAFFACSSCLQLYSTVIAFSTLFFICLP